MHDQPIIQRRTVEGQRDYFQAKATELTAECHQLRRQVSRLEPAARRYLAFTSDRSGASWGETEAARIELHRALAGMAPARPAPADGYQVPGSVWRIGIDRRGDDGMSHPIPELHTSSDGHPPSVIDEVVIQGWLHVEQMDHDVWWLGVGDWHLNIIVAPDGTAAHVTVWEDAPHPRPEITLDSVTDTLGQYAARFALLTHDRHRLAEALRGLLDAVHGRDGAPSVADATSAAELVLEDTEVLDHTEADSTRQAATDQNQEGRP